MPSNPWNDYADAYSRHLATRQTVAFHDDVMFSRLLDCMGDVDGKNVLDAGCGEGLLARALAARGAKVTGIDLSPRLITMAREQDPEGTIDYRISDLSRPQPDLEGHFDAIGSYLVLNDVERFREFAAALAAVAKSGGKVALAFNSPYASVVKGHISDYFASGMMGTYQGLWDRGVKAQYYHRTLEEYLDAFLNAGLVLVKLVDVPDVFGLEWILPPECRFPRFMILVFEKP